MARVVIVDDDQFHDAERGLDGPPVMNCKNEADGDQVNGFHKRLPRSFLIL